MTILLTVDDNPDVRWVTAECLHGVGHAVKKARNGGAALTLLERGDPYSPLQTFKPTEHREHRNKPQHRQSHPYDDLPWSIISTRSASAHLRLDFSVPFADDVFWVGLHQSFPVSGLIGGGRVRPDRA